MKSYRLYWIPAKEKPAKMANIMPSKKEYIGTYRTIEDTKNAAKNYSEARKFKNQAGMFFRNEVGTSQFIWAGS